MKYAVRGERSYAERLVSMTGEALQPSVGCFAQSRLPKPKNRETARRDGQRGWPRLREGVEDVECRAL